MNSLKLEKAAKWLFALTLAAGIIMGTTIELLPFVMGIIFLSALPAFPEFRCQIRWHRVFLLGAAALPILLGMYYWFTKDFSYGFTAWFSGVAVWPLEDNDDNTGPLSSWLPFWLMKGLLFGFIIESFLALGKQPGIQRIAACARRNSEEQGNVPPFGLAGILCLACLVAAFFVARPLAGLSPRLNEWLLPALMIIGPAATAFMVLYRSSWQRELPAPRRVVAIIIRSSAIFGVVSFITLVVLVAMAFLASAQVSRGQYGRISISCRVV